MPDFEKMYFNQAAGITDIINQLQRLMLEGEAMYTDEAEVADPEDPEPQLPPLSG